MTVYDSLPDAGTVAAERAGGLRPRGRPAGGSSRSTSRSPSPSTAPDAGSEEAGRFFATLVRLLRHPYRLLV